MKGLVVLSGGIDSTVLMYWLHSQGYELEAFYCDYGQATSDTQYKYLFEHCANLQIPICPHRVYWPSWARGKGTLFQAGSPGPQMKDPYEAIGMSEEQFAHYQTERRDFLQGRNTIFLTWACAYAVSKGIERVYTGFQLDDPEWDSDSAVEPILGCDTTPPFVDAFNLLLCSGFSKHVEVVCPFLENKLTKQDIVNLGRELQVDLDRTYSCERYPACGKCHQCLVRERVLAPVKFS